MKRGISVVLAASWSVLCHAAVLYVDPASPNPAAPFDVWTNAAHDIQAAIDVAQPYDTVLVTNGVYDTGARVVEGRQASNRVVMTTDHVRVMSVNGPAVTFIVGAKSGIRCVYMDNGAFLSGFTLTNAFPTAVTGIDDGGGAYVVEGTISNCVITGCVVSHMGGGVFGGTVYDSHFIGNTCWGYGGGVASSTLHRCIIEGSLTTHEAAGAYGCTLIDCRLHHNRTPAYAGGASQCVLERCIVADNVAEGAGGIAESTANACAIYRNVGGGASQCSLDHCIVAWNEGGGCRWGTSSNSIVWNNIAETNANVYSVDCSYTCTTPLPTGPGNIDVDPGLASFTHIQIDSPCIGAGIASGSAGDIDGESWAASPAIGCDEVVVGAVTGPISLLIVSSTLKAVWPRPLTFIGETEGRITRHAWDFGDGTIVSNMPIISHEWASTGEYVVTLTAFNEDYPLGVSTSVTVLLRATGDVHYVDAASTNPISPYLSWETAATVIQDAINAADTEGSTVLVADGIYSNGMASSPDAFGENRVVITNELTVRSVHGPERTVIDGGGSRCAFLATNTLLEGFTLSNGAAVGWYGMDWDAEGAGARSLGGTLLRCIVCNNRSSGPGGGLSGGLARNCLFVGNTAYYNAGGGAARAILQQCTLTSNIAYAADTGAATESELNDCIRFENWWYDNWGHGMSYHLQDTTVNPRFVDPSGYDYRLLPDSPCINVGTNEPWMVEAVDIEGKPRILYGTVDLGAYEFVSATEDEDHDELPDAWEWRFGGSVTGLDAEGDADADGFNNRGECRAGTDATNSASWLGVMPGEDTAEAGPVVRWPSVSNRLYTILRSTNLLTGFDERIAVHIPATPPLNTCTDTTANGAAAYYAIGVE